MWQLFNLGAGDDDGKVFVDSRIRIAHIVNQEIADLLRPVHSRRRERFDLCELMKALLGVVGDDVENLGRNARQISIGKLPIQSQRPFEEREPGPKVELWAQRILTNQVGRPNLDQLIKAGTKSFAYFLCRAQRRLCSYGLDERK